MMEWATAPFEVVYTSIETDTFDTSKYEEVLPDLKTLNVLDGKAKNSASRAQLEKGQIKVPSGDNYQINQEFAIAAITLSDELNLDELLTAEIMLQNCDLDSVSENSVISLVNDAKVAFYVRRQYILQIVSFITNCCSSEDKVYIDLVSDGTLAKNIIPAFKQIESQLGEIKVLVNKSAILESYDTFAQQNVRFRRDFLLKEYDTLSQILYGLVKNGTLMKKDMLLELINCASMMDSGDFFIIYFLPALFLAISQLHLLPDGHVREMHQTLLLELESDTISVQPVKASLIFAFLAFFIGWCKAAPSQRAKSFNFATDVDEPMTKAVELGAIEQLMAFAADTSELDKDESIELFYDIRSLLERHIPRLYLKQLVDGDQPSPDATNNQRLLTNASMSQQSLSFFLSAFHHLLQVVITDCAFLLTKMKDAEEDSLLSGEDLFLDEISAKADLERFFITVHYFYAFRPDYSAVFWQDKESNAYGFIEWAMKCTDTLMRSCVFMMLSSLSFGPENSANVYHYVNLNANLSWNTVSQLISDYIVKISELERKLLDGQQRDREEQDPTTIALKTGLNEEVIILLSSLYTLIGCVAHDLNEGAKAQLSSLFTDILFEFVKVDTPLVGAALKVLSNLVPYDELERSKFWFNLDSWIFKGFRLTISDDSYREAFENILTHFQNITGFLQLLNSLLKVRTKSTNGYLEFGLLQFPPKLGHGYRKLGIWPYFDYVFHGVLAQSNKLPNPAERAAIHKPILEILSSALSSFDYSVILNSIPAGSNLDELVVTDNFLTYAMESSTTAVLNYLFEENVFKNLLQNASFGVEKMGSITEEDCQSLALPCLALSTINHVLTIQETYVEELCPIVKKNASKNYFIPKDFGLHGLRSFYDAISFDLPLIVGIGLYVGHTNYKIASNSLDILDKISTEMKGRDSQAIVKDKLLSVFDSVDESARIKQAFINQLQTSITNYESFSIKMRILDFISKNLSYTDKQPTVAHFLLGLQIGNTISLGPDLSTFVTSGCSVLTSIIYLLQSSLMVLSSEEIEFLPAKLASSSMEILLKLCKNSATSKIVLRHMSESDFFETILARDPKVDVNTRWSGEVFAGNSAGDSLGFIKQTSTGAFLSFLSYRSFALQYLSLDIHGLSGESLKSRIKSRIDLLISNYLQPPRLFSFLDALSFDARPSPHETLKGLKVLSGINFSLPSLQKVTPCTELIYDCSELESLIRLRTQFLGKHLPLNFHEETITNKETLDRISGAEAATIEKHLTDYMSFEQFKSLQLSLLHSWVQLVQVVVLDGALPQVSISDFILRLFEAIVPKINDYVELDVCYSEELVSLCVFLYDLYQKDQKLNNGEHTADGRLIALFLACINGIRSPLSTLALRSDFYILANRFLVSIMKEVNTAKQVLKTLKLTSERLVEVVCNDAISGEGSSRITGILFLDSLVQIAGLNKVNFVLESLVKSNMLLLISHSIKTTDDLLSSGLEGITLDNLLYELTAFKSTIHFLIRIAESRSGAQALVENEIFRVIESCEFLEADPDLGLELIFTEVRTQESQAVRVTFSLDKSLNLSKDACGLSLFEIIVPVFQLMTSILISMGSANKPVLKKTRNLLIHFRKLVQGVLKRDALIEGSDENHLDRSNSEGLQKLVKLVVLLCTLTGYNGRSQKNGLDPKIYTLPQSYGNK